MPFIAGGAYLMPFIGSGGRAMIGGAAVTLADTPPSIRTDGQLWMDTTIWRLFISWMGAWIQVP